jgi:hypothetical protein
MKKFERSLIEIAVDTKSDMAGEQQCREYEDNALGMVQSAPKCPDQVCGPPSLL